MSEAEAKPFRFIIHGQPATKKNSATLVYGRGKGARPIPTLLPSKTYRAYEKHCREALTELRKGTAIPHYDGPVRIVAHYYLESKAHWPDLLGLEQATADIISDEYKVVNHKRTLTKEWILSDDRIIKSWDGSMIKGIDKQDPRVDVRIYPLRLDAESELDPQLQRRAMEAMQQGLFEEGGSTE
jgi:hypothetical protein